MRILTTLLGLAIAFSVSGCASTAGGGSEGQGAFLSYDDCFFANSITDWRPLDNRNLIVFTGVRRPYHVQLTMRAMSLRFEDTIAFTDRDGRICPYGGDSIIVDGAMRDRIPIASIRRLTEPELEDLYRQFGVRVPEVVETPAEAEDEE